MLAKKHYLLNARLVVLITVGILLISTFWYYLGDDTFWISLTLHIVNIIALVIIALFWFQTQRRLVTEKYRVQVLQKEQAQSQSFITETIVNNNNFNHNLANVVAGINHELSPWIGNSMNILARMRTQYEQTKTADLEKVFKKIDLVYDALNRSAHIMSVVSRNIKHLKLHSNDKSNLKVTVQSWIGLLFVNEVIKRNIEQTQFEVDYASIDFEVTHSPMLMSQIFLNLIKNTIEHNTDRLPQIRVRIYGTKDQQLVIEDNGCGVPSHMIHKIFVPEVTTKKDGDIHGLGLSICQEYCKLMCARLSAEHVFGGGLRFIIDFEAHNGSGLVPIIEE